MAFSQLLSRWAGPWRGHGGVYSVGIVCPLPVEHVLQLTGQESTCIPADGLRSKQNAEGFPGLPERVLFAFPAISPSDPQLFPAGHSAFLSSFQQLPAASSGCANHPLKPSLTNPMCAHAFTAFNCLPPSGVRSYARRRRAAAFDLSDYLPSSESPATRLSRPQTPSLPRPSAVFLGKENTPEMRAKAELFEQAQLAFQQRGYLVHPKSSDREQQLIRLEKIFEVFGKHGFPVMGLQAALKWEVRHLEKARDRGADAYEPAELEEELEQEWLGSAERDVPAGSEPDEGAFAVSKDAQGVPSDGSGISNPVEAGVSEADFDVDLEGSSEGDEEQLDRARFHTRAERKAMKKALEEAAKAKHSPESAEQSGFDEHEGVHSEASSELQDDGSVAGRSNQSQDEPSTPKASSLLQDSFLETEAAGADGVSAPGGADVADNETPTGTEKQWKRTVRKKRKAPEGLPPGTPFEGSLRGLEKGADEGGVFTEFARAPTQPAHRGGQGPGLTLRQKRLAAQIQRELAEIIVNDAGLRGSLLEDAGFAALEVRLTPELDTAFIRWTCNEGSEKEVEKQLGRVAGRLRTGLFKALAMPFSPRLEFRYDTLSAQIHAIEDAFDRLHDL